MRLLAQAFGWRSRRCRFLRSETVTWVPNNARVSLYLHRACCLCSVHGAQNRHSMKGQSNERYREFKRDGVSGCVVRREVCIAARHHRRPRCTDDATAVARRRARSKEQKAEPHAENGQLHAFFVSAEFGLAQMDRQFVCFSNREFANEESPWRACRRSGRTKNHNSGRLITFTEQGQNMVRIVH